MFAVLPPDLPTDLVDAMRRSLGHANAQSLKRRIALMLHGLGEATLKLFCVNQELFVKGAVDTRNHYTHYSTDDGDCILQLEEFHWATQKLSLMLRIILLLKAGLPENVIQSALRSNIQLSNEQKVWKGITEEGSPYKRGEAD